ncbi:MAG: PSD1 and planctomycete cytochrome C domain-containing protein [Limisphaerales bacterium]
MAFRCTALTAAEENGIPAEQVTFFEQKIRPVMVKHCYKCHSQREDKDKGGLTLDSRSGLRAGGSSGYVILPGDPANSLLLKAIRHIDEDLQMPPDYKLSSRIASDFEQWIKMGAPDPRVDDPGTAAVNWRDPKLARDFWAFKVPEKPSLPQLKDSSWPRNDIDFFVQSKREEQGMKPVVDADKAALVRRAYYDLLGLPPSPKTIENFSRSTDPTAWGRVIDMLMASESFGEKWGRHWLDIARYAESSGKEANITFPHAWRYRDYVIKAFNEDKPYDRFIQEQIAGDLLRSESKEQRAELMVATGFLAMGPKSLNEANPAQFRMDQIDEQIDTMSKSILGVTIACARCHDHKFDPISQREYYAMAGIFLSTEALYGTVATQGNRRSSQLLSLPIKETEYAGRVLTGREMNFVKTRLESEQEKRSKLFNEAREARRSGKEVDRGRVQQQMRRLNTTVNVAQNQLDIRDEDGNPLPLAMGARDSRRITNARLLDRGEIENAREFIQRGFVYVLSADNQNVRLPRTRSGRKELAEWLTADSNPLFARVMANRIWSWLMGQGIVETVDNFGVNGKRPTHPELLDYLAVRFKEHGYSVKKLIKEIMMSRTYQLASIYNARSYHKDPDNVYYWRKDKRRLTAEEVRDSILAISGKLDYDPPKGSQVAYKGDGFIGRGLGGITEKDVIGETLDPFRSIYLPVVRDLLPEVFNVFDFAEPSLVIGKRDVTIVPGQALYFMNSPFVIQEAKNTAQRIYEEEKTGRDRINRLYMLAVGRMPSSREFDLAARYIQDFVATANQEGSEPRQATYLALSTFCQSLMASSEFRYIN